MLVEPPVTSSLDAWAPSLLGVGGRRVAFAGIDVSHEQVRLTDDATVTLAAILRIHWKVSYSTLVTAIVHLIQTEGPLLLDQRVYARSRAFDLQSFVDSVGFCAALRPGAPADASRRPVIVGTRPAIQRLAADAGGAEVACSDDGIVDFRGYEHLWQTPIDPQYRPSEDEWQRIRQLEGMGVALARTHGGQNGIPVLPDVTVGNFVDTWVVDPRQSRPRLRITAPQAAANLRPLLDEITPLEWRVFRHHYRETGGRAGRAVVSCIEEADPYGWSAALEDGDYARARPLLWNVLRHFPTWTDAPPAVLANLAVCESNIGANDAALHIYRQLLRGTAEDDETYGVLCLNLAKALARGGDDAEAARLAGIAAEFAGRRGQPQVARVAAEVLTALGGAPH